MRVLVTGGAGFIGSHLAEELTKRGQKIVVFDNLRTGRLENLANIEHSFVNADIRDYDALKAALKDCKYVYHLAALTSVVESMEKIEECIAINLQGTLNVLKAAKEKEVKKVIFASSAAVYGDSPELPKNETMRLEPKSPYAITKADGEYYSNLYTDFFKVPTVAARFFNAFGERQDPNSAYASAIPIFIRKALRNEPIVIYGDGTQTRDFIYVKDIVKALIFLIENSCTGVYNIGYGKKIDINSLVNLIKELTGSDSKIHYLPERAGEIKHSFAAVNKLMKLGFKPDYAIKDGLMKTIEFMRKDGEN